MAAPTTLFTTYVWQSGDTLRRVAGRQMTGAGYTDALQFGEDIRTANLPGNVPTGLRGIIDWITLPAGSTIVIPHAS